MELKFFVLRREPKGVVIQQRISSPLLAIAEL